MPQPNSFAPGRTLVLTPSAGSTSQAIPGAPGAMRVYNEGPGNVYLRVAFARGGTDTASASDMVLPSGYLEYFQLSGHDTIAAYCTSSATINIIFGGIE
jgi:hypothetical protein